MEYRSHQSCECYCVLRVGASWFALPALAVREVCPASEPVRLPDSPALLAGIVHLRNEFLAVLRLDDLAGEREGETQPERQLLVLSGPQQSLGGSCGRGRGISAAGSLGRCRSQDPGQLGGRCVRLRNLPRTRRASTRSKPAAPACRAGTVPRMDRLGAPSVVVPVRSALEGTDDGKRFVRGANNDYGTTVVEGVEA